MEDRVEHNTSAVPLRIGVIDGALDDAASVIREYIRTTSPSSIFSRVMDEARLHEDGEVRDEITSSTLPLLLKGHTGICLISGIGVVEVILENENDGERNMGHFLVLEPGATLTPKWGSRSLPDMLKELFGKEE